MYRAQSDVHRDAWPPVGNKTYINLALVKQREINKGDVYSYSTIQGDVDDVFHKKESIEYVVAFNKHRSGALLLIEGRPGSGKTTLVHKVSEDWAKGRFILKGAKLVFLISLRVLSAKALVKLPDIMTELFYKNDHETAQSVLKRLNSTNGEGVCFILDGLDEYEKNESVISEIIDKTYLQQSMVILSSRPNATFAFRRKASVYIEVVGFLKNQILEYISNYPFTSKGSTQNLLCYLDQHPNVLRMCYLPVHMAMVSYLYDQIENDLPSTECEMYTHFTNLTLRRKEGSYFNSLTNESLMKVCKLAFQMTASHRQFFVDKELSLSDTNSKNPSLNLVTVDHTAGLYGYHNFYTFAHLTFQEYLAAYYMSRLEEQEQIEMISKYGGRQYMRVVWKFYCGLVSFKNEDPKFTMILELNDDSLFYCQCAFESQQPATCKSVVLHNNGSMKFSSTHPVDFTCLKYTILNSSSPLESLAISDISTGDRTAKLHAFADVLEQCSQLKALDLSFSQLDSEDFKCLSHGLNQCSHLSKLNLCHNGIGNEGAKELGIGIRQCSCYLSILNLDANFISVEGIKSLGENLRHCNNLSELRLCHNKIGEEGAKSLGDCLKQCSNLSVLFVHSCEVGDEGAKGLSDCLRQCKNLSQLGLDGNEISDEGVKGLGDSIKQCSNLSELYLSRNKIGDEGIRSLGDCLKQCSNLSILFVNSNKIGDEGAKGLGDGLRQCKNLSLLGLDDNKIGDEGVKGLCDSLTQCSSLSELCLGQNKIGDEGAKSIGDCLKQCSYMSVLRVNDNKIGDEGAKGLSDGLRQCKNLSELRLDGNKIGDKGIQCLNDTLRQYCYLHELF